MGTSGLFSVTGGKPWKGWKQRHNGLRCVCLLVDFGCRESERDQTYPGQRISEEAVVRAKQKVRMAVKVSSSARVGEEGGESRTRSTSGLFI